MGRKALGDGAVRVSQMGFYPRGYVGNMLAQPRWPLAGERNPIAKIGLLPHSRGGDAVGIWVRW